jgi:hypothetical protein
MEGKCIPPSILNLDTRWRSIISFTSQPIYFVGKSPRYPLDTRLDGPQTRSIGGGEEKKSPPYSESNLDSSVSQPAA